MYGKRRFCWPRLIFGVLAILVMMTIFYFSAQDAETSTGTSSGFIDALCRWLSKRYTRLSATEQLGIIHRLSHFVRKAAHFTVYALLGFTTAGYTATWSLPKPFVYGASQVWCSLYAVSDEWHQGFSAGRHPGWDDVLLDSLGAACGILLLLLIHYCIKRWKNHERQSH